MKCRKGEGKPTTTLAKDENRIHVICKIHHTTVLSENLLKRQFKLKY